MTEDLTDYLGATAYIDADHPDVVARARELTRGCATDAERLERIYYFVRELPYDILASFRYLAEGRRQASDVLRHGTAFCMGKASSFVALCRAAGIPARVGFQQIHCPDKPFMSEEVRRLWKAEQGRAHAALAERPEDPLGELRRHLAHDPFFKTVSFDEEHREPFVFLIQKPEKTTPNYQRRIVEFYGPWLEVVLEEWHREFIDSPVA